MQVKDSPQYDESEVSPCNSSWFYRTVIGLLYFYMKIFFRLRIRYIDKASIEALRSTPCIIAPNHISYLDPPLVAATWPSPLHFFASEHLFQQSKWFSWVLGRLNSHPVNRGHGVQAVKDAINLLQREKKSIVIFPEGTRSQDGLLRRELEEGVAFMSIKATCPIIPVYIKGAYEIWPKNRMLPRCSGRISITYGKPIQPLISNETGRKRIQTLTYQLREEIDLLSKEES